MLGLLGSGMWVWQVHLGAACHGVLLFRGDWHAGLAVCYFGEVHFWTIFLEALELQEEETGKRKMNTAEFGFFVLYVIILL